MRIVYYLLLVMLPSMANAEVYKWVDKNGNVHFGDKAGHTDAVEMNIKGEARPNANNYSGEEGLTREEKRQRILDAMNEDRVERDKNKEEEKIKKKNKQIRCARLKDKLRSVTGATGVYDLDKDGNRVFLSHKDRAKSESNLRKTIEKNCR